jgi:arginine N-succinyltransferase
MGTCGIASKIGGFEPHWTYELKYQTFESKTLKTLKEVPYLQIKTNHNGPSEIGTLFLSPEARGKGPWGRFLSLVRFSFIAAYPECFENEIIAEMRGQIDDQDRSVFWEALGRHFFDMDFKQADRLSMHNKHIIADLMPTHPIYVPLLPKSAQEVIAKTHPDTVPALRLLEQEGFLFTGEVDIFEAGPVVSCSRDQIRTVQDSEKSIYIDSFEDPTTPPNKIIARLDSFSHFSATLGHLVELEDGVSVSNSTKNTLHLEKGDPLLYVSLRPKVES